VSTERAASSFKAAVAVSVCLLACLALLPAQGGAAQDGSTTASPDSLWEAYPLAPTAQPGTQAKTAASPAAGTRTDRRPVGATRTGSEDGAPVSIIVLLALAAAVLLTLTGMRRRRESEPLAAAVPQPSRSTAGAPDGPLWRDTSGRFSKSVTRTPAAVMVAASEHQRGTDEDAGDDPPSREDAAGPAEVEPRPVTPIFAPAPAGAPPDPDLPWTAELEWRQIRGEAHFCVVARGADTVEVAHSPALAWPPDGEAEVQAVADAADELARTLAAAGWKPLPPGTAWYAKRFAWEPAGAESAEDTRPPESVGSPEASPNGSTGAKRAAPPRPARRAAPADDSGAGDTRRSHAKAVVFLGMLTLVGLIAALQLGDASDDDGGRPAPDGGTDLTIPLLELVSVVLLVLLIRRMRRRSRESRGRG
jgi:MYXO-CTERM domain-containing protein